MRAKQALRPSGTLLALMVLLIAESAPAQQTPSAQAILEDVRFVQSQQQVDLQGQLREGNNVVPFRLTATGPTIKWSFANPGEALQLRLGEEDSRLEHLTHSGSEKITPAKYDEKVRGTSVSYEDLALKFLYWPKAEMVGEETIRTRRCWKLQLKAPNPQSQYSNVFLWVDQAGGAIMRMEGYDSNGRLAKRFEVISGQKIDGRWFLKQMRVEEFEPGTARVRGRTYLEIKK